MADYVGRYHEPSASVAIRAADDGLRLSVERGELAGQIQPRLSADLPSDVPMTFA
jgi:hypothetical protein